MASHTTIAGVIAVIAASIPGVHSVLSVAGNIEGRLSPVVGEFEFKDQYIDRDGDIVVSPVVSKYRPCQPADISGAIQPVAIFDHLPDATLLITRLDSSQSPPNNPPSKKIELGRWKLNTARFPTDPLGVVVSTTHDCGGFWFVRTIHPEIPVTVKRKK